jgi:hypothetical protein
MKTNSMRGRWIFPALLTAVLAWANAAVAADEKSDEKTAFELIKEGNKYVGEQAKDKVVEMRSERSVGSLKPNIWYIVYEDRTATFNAVEVKFGAGKMMDVDRPMRLFQPIRGDDEKLDPNKMKIDSDKAIEIVLNEPLLKGIDVKSVRLKSDRGDGDPVWEVELWAARLDRPDRNRDIGEVHVSMEDGKVVKNDLKPGRLN